MSRIKVTFTNPGGPAQCPADPRFPAGIDVNLALGSSRFCQTKIPYPASERGTWLLTCKRCGCTAVVTAAGRRDDPRSARIACKGRKPAH